MQTTGRTAAALSPLLFFSGRCPSDRDHGFAHMTAGEKRPDLRDAGKDVDETESRDGAAYEVVDQKRLQGRDQLREVVPLPVPGPRENHQYQTGFEEEHGQKQAHHAGELPWTTRSRSM